MEKIVSDKKADDLHKRANSLKYSSLKYVEMEEIEDGILVIDDEDGIFIYKDLALLGAVNWEFSSEKDLQVFWAAPSKESFLRGMEKLVSYIRSNEIDSRKLYMEFIAEEFLEDMEALGYKVVSEWVDYWKRDLVDFRASESSNILIERARPEDLSSLSGLTKSCKGYSRGFLGESIESLSDWLESEDSYLFKGISDEEILGMAYVKLYGFEGKEGPTLWIRELAVKPTSQSKGIGRSLMNYGLKWGKDKGASKSFLAVDGENHKAIALYESLAYVRDGERGQINMELDL